MLRFSLGTKRHAAAFSGTECRYKNDTRKEPASSCPLGGAGVARNGLVSNGINPPSEVKKRSKDRRRARAYGAR